MLSSRLDSEQTLPMDPGVVAGVLGRLGSVLGRLGSVLAASWAVLGASWARLVASCCVLVASWARLGASWSVKPPKKPVLAPEREARLYSSAVALFGYLLCFSTLATCKNTGTSPHLYAPLASLAALARSLRLYNGYLFYSCAVATCKNVKCFLSFS